MADNTDLETIYGTPSTSEDDYIRQGYVRVDARELHKTIVAECPMSRERSEALKYVELAMLWANEAIRRNEDKRLTAEWSK